MSKKFLKKMLIVSLMLCLMSLFMIFDIGHYLTFAYVKASQQKLAALYNEHRLLVIGAYVLTSLLTASLSLPSAGIMSIAGGAIFGLWTGILIVSLATTTGGTIACFIARFLLRDWVQSRFHDIVPVINSGVEKEGAFYLFTLRLIPVLPFFIINLVMGLTKMPLRTFYWVSLLGIMPVTIVFVNAGDKIARIDSLSGLVSPQLIFSFVIIGLLPIVSKKTISLYKAWKAGSKKN